MGRGDQSEVEAIEFIPRRGVALLSSNQADYIDDADVAAVNVYIDKLDSATYEGIDLINDGGYFSDDPDDAPYIDRVFLSDQTGHSFGVLRDDTGDGLEWLSDSYPDQEEIDQLEALRKACPQTFSAAEIADPNEDDPFYDQKRGVSLYLRQLNEMQDTHRDQITPDLAQIAVVQLTSNQAMLKKGAAAVGLLELDTDGAQWVWRPGYQSID